MDGAVIATDAAKFESGEDLFRIRSQKKKTLIVPETDIITRLVVLDQAAFGKNGFGLVPDDYIVNIMDAFYQSPKFWGSAAERGPPEI